MERPGETAEECGRSWLPWAGLVAMLVVYLALATLQSFATRLQWGPDEPAHIIYVRSLAMDGRLPTLTHEQTDDAYLPGASRTHQAHHPPLYYALASLFWRAFAERTDDIVRYLDLRSGEESTFAVPGPVRPVRFFSVLLGAMTLLFLWATARTVFPNRPDVWLGGVALTAFTPMFTYVNGVISNDPLMTGFFGATAWQWARIMRFGASNRDVLLLGLLVGVALNVKETALALLPLTALVLALEPGAGSRRQRAARFGVVLLLAAALGGWWFLRKWLIYGKPLVYPYFQPLLALPEEQRRLVLTALPASAFMFTFIPLDVVASHMDLRLASGFFGALAMLSAGGLGLAFARGKRLGAASCEAQSLLLWLLAAAIVLAGWLRNALFIDWRMGPHGGRYLIPVLPLLALASARGLTALFGERRASQIALAAISLLALAVNLYAIWATAAGYQTLGFASLSPP